jgi:L-histidine Nalpha-methyltransferase
MSSIASAHAPAAHQSAARETADSDFARDLLAGLSARPKRLAPKYFYDGAGSQLFERITALPEYYPTRTELRILADHAADIARFVPDGAALVEFGSGSSTKVRLLLKKLPRLGAYVPVDISAEFLEEEAARLRQEFPSLAVMPIAADFTQPFALPHGLSRRPLSGFFPGSTIGNFELEGAVAFLRRALATLGAGSRMLLGADLVKGQAVLEAAYDDAAGVTAAFDLNLLHRLNREAGADFDVAAFRHRAVWNPVLERVEMHLVAQRVQAVHLAGRTIRFAAGETIHTESSHKYRPERLAELAAAAGWRAARMWTDPAALFSVWLLEA